MDDSQPQAVALSPCAAPDSLFDSDDLRWFASAFVAGFLFFLIWLG